MSTKREVTSARVELMQLAMHERGTFAVDYYPPAKWALARGYVEIVGLGSNRYRITDAGRQWLAAATSTPKKDNSK